MSGKNYILDTHCLLWFMEDNPKIPAQVMAQIQDPDNTIFFSQLTLYEIAIKQKIGKLPEFNSTIEEIYDQAIANDFTFLQIRNSHIYSYQKVTLYNEHRDPFDRLLVATAMEEKAAIISIDEKFSLYPEFIKVFWE